MNQKLQAKLFAGLHVKGNPLIIYNAWDAGSAKSISEAGAKAIGTSSWAVSAAQGYKDGEKIPLDVLERISERIVKTITLPITIDFEGGFAEFDEKLAQNIKKIIKTGIVGINFEDQVVASGNIYNLDTQVKRLETVRQAASEAGIDLFINARTDVFFINGENKKSVTDAIIRGRAYAKAGASGLFIPGATDSNFIEQICREVDLPINVMVTDNTPSLEQLSKIGVARISYGTIPYISSMKNLTTIASKVTSV